MKFIALLSILAIFAFFSVELAQAWEDLEDCPMGNYKDDTDCEDCCVAHGYYYRGAEVYRPYGRGSERCRCLGPYTRE